MLTVRMDKYLWAARFFKTRALAADACDLGRVTSNGQRAKASRDVRTGDRLHIRSEAGEFHIDVLALSDIRGPAATAQALFHETDDSRTARLQLAEEQKEAARQGFLPEGRPSKHHRQELSRLRGKIHRF